MTLSVAQTRWCRTIELYVTNELGEAVEGSTHGLVSATIPASARRDLGKHKNHSQSPDGGGCSLFNHSQLIFRF